jgi:predicted permease
MSAETPYRALLYLYPSSFRAEYGDEMTAVFARRRRSAKGALAKLALTLGALLEVPFNAFAVHWDLLRQDLGYAARTLLRAPGFALTALLLLALGVGANTAAYSVTDFVLLRPLPFPDADRLVNLWVRLPGYNRVEASPANYRDWKRLATLFESLGAYHPASVNLVGQGDPLRLEGVAVTAELLPTLGVSPIMGRLFTADDDLEDAPGTLLLSHRLWQTAFGGDATVLGRPVRLDDQPYTVIGVMGPEFQYPNRDNDFWMAARLAEANYADRSDAWMLVIGRLKPGVALERVRAEMDVVAAQLRQQYPKENEQAEITVNRMRDELSSQSLLLLFALCGAALCVLLIACANLASLLLARGLARRQELAVRAAMGAGRERLLRQLATEGLLLAVLGGVLGVGVAAASVPLLSRLVPAILPVAATPSIDLRVLAFALVLTALTGLAFSLAPALRASGQTDLHGLREGERSGGGQKERLRSTLVVAEIVASIVLLVSAGLLLRALWTLRATDPGFRSDGVLTARTALPLPKYGGVTARTAFYTRVLSEVRVLPGVSAAAYITGLPMVMRGGIWGVTVPGEPEGPRTDSQNASLRYVTPGYFATLGIPIRQGRDVNEGDIAQRPYVAVVSESFVRRYWPGQDPLGRRFKFALNDREVVGVAADIRVRGFEQKSEPQVYLPAGQVADNSIIGYIPKDLIVRSSIEPSALVPAIRDVVRRADPELPISDVRTMGDVVDTQTASRAVQSRVIGAFALVAAILAAVGIHGMLALAVAQRSREFGVRIALGAEPRDILRMVLRQSVRLAVAGVVPGIALAYAAARALEGLLAGVKPADPATFLAVLTLSLVMTVAGSLVPTLRAVRLDPVQAIRSE